MSKMKTKNGGPTLKNCTLTYPDGRPSKTLKPKECQAMQRKMKAAGTFSGIVATDANVNYAEKSGGWKKAVQRKKEEALKNK